jgi:prepilin-type N-terminal cleavage/methylation domain-containing protein
MNTSRHQLNFRQGNQTQGFTLIELLIGMSLTTIVAALALQAIVRTQSSFNTDQKTVETSQKISSVLDVVGRDVRQAGELLVEANFPIIQVKPLANGGSSLIIYRALSEPISICKDYVSGTATSELVFATDKKVSAASTLDANADKLYCTVDPGTVASPTIVSPNIFPPKQQESWIGQRLIARDQKAFGMIYKATSRATQSFVYTSESNPSNYSGGSLNLKIGVNSLTPPTTQDIKIGDIAYLVEKKEYIVCGTELKVRINSNQESTASAINPGCAAPNASSDPTATLETVATNIEKLDITMTTRLLPTTTNPNPSSEVNGLNSTFPITTTGSERSWQNIQGVKISIKSIDPLNRVLTGLSSEAQQKILQSLTSEGDFYPRNVLSAK